MEVFLVYQNQARLRAYSGVICVLFSENNILEEFAFFFVKSENWSRFVFDNCSAEFWQFYITHLKMVWTTLSGIRTTHNGDTLLVCDIKGR